MRDARSISGDIRTSPETLNVFLRLEIFFPLYFLGFLFVAGGDLLWFNRIFTLISSDSPKGLHLKAYSDVC
jgi:hypothetical protein